MAEVYGLRTCDEHLRSHGGFQWPASGLVAAPDYDPLPRCGGGLHYLVNGEGDSTLLDWGPNAKWLVVRAVEGHLAIDEAKAKAEVCEVRHVGDRHTATKLLRSLVGPLARIHGITEEAGDKATLCGGDRATLTAGGHSTLKAGGRSTLTAEANSTLTAGEGSTLTAGWGSTLKAGWRSTLKAGEGSTFTAGEGSTFICRWYDVANCRWAVVVATVGKGGLQPNTPYRCENGVWTQKGESDNG